VRLQMMLGIAATSDRGFVEQRVMMGAAGLEHIMWQTLVLEGGMGESEYRNQDATGSCAACSRARRSLPRSTRSFYR
jgi:hypothetical protein